MISSFIGPEKVRENRDSLNSRIMAAYKPFMQQFGNPNLPEILEQRYGVPETRLLPIEQLSDFAEFLEGWLMGHDDGAA